MNRPDTPRLKPEGAGAETRKPEELENEDIVILRNTDTRLPDGRSSCKWLVRRANGERAIYWSAGQDPTMWVAAWFVEHPDLPLFCRIYRTPNKYGTQVWQIDQREADDVQDTATRRADSLEKQLEEVGL